MKRRDFAVTVLVAGVLGALGKFPSGVSLGEGGVPRLPKLWGDGVHDDANALQARIDAARVGGPPVDLRDRRFLVSKPIHWYEDTASPVTIRACYFSCLRPYLFVGDLNA
jgi:hypothetical protein